MSKKNTVSSRRVMASEAWTASASQGRKHRLRSMRNEAGRNAKSAAEMAETSKRDGATCDAIEIDVSTSRRIGSGGQELMPESAR